MNDINNPFDKGTSEQGSFDQDQGKESRGHDDGHSPNADERTAGGGDHTSQGGPYGGDHPSYGGHANRGESHYDEGRQGEHHGEHQGEHHEGHHGGHGPEDGPDGPEGAWFGFGPGFKGGFGPGFGAGFGSGFWPGFRGGFASGPHGGFTMGARGGFGPGSGPGFGPRGGFGPGFGPGFGSKGGFGPGGRGGFGRDGRVRKGNVRSAILSLLSQHRYNGYGLIGAIATHTDGAWRPSPGSVYPTLAALQAEGLIESVGEGRRSEFALTDDGRRYVAEHAEEMAAVWADVSEEAGVGRELRHSMHKLVGAVQQIRIAGTEDQVKAATEAIDTARRAIYKLLAD